jgi:nucleoside-diphosphate-sugar epimerase
VTRTAFVTGAKGFVGLNLVSELVSQGWRVTALHRPNANANVKYLSQFSVEKVRARSRIWIR